MEPASRRRYDRTGRLSRRYLFEGECVLVVSVRCCLEQCVGAGMELIVQKLVYSGLFDNIARVHDKDAF